MKKIPKKLLDECIEATRAYWNEDFNQSLLTAKKRTASKLAEAIEIDWLAVEMFFDGILNSKGFYPDAENDEIYCALRCMGWEPTDEKKGR